MFKSSSGSTVSSFSTTHYNAHSIAIWSLCGALFLSATFAYLGTNHQNIVARHHLDGPLAEGLRTRSGSKHQAPLVTRPTVEERTPPWFFPDRHKSSD
uniref:Transmembrane protein n=1 Tax=Steinernema glaseri TaxID=37863 RepID=A0A1I7ZT54_9BILA